MFSQNCLSFLSVDVSDGLTIFIDKPSHPLIGFTILNIWFYRQSFNYQVKPHLWVTRVKTLAFLFAGHTSTRYSDKVVDDLEPNLAIEISGLLKPA